MYSSRKHAVELVDLNSMEIVFEHQACFNKLKFQTGSFDFHDPQVRFNSHLTKELTDFSILLEIAKRNLVAAVERTFKGDWLEMGNHWRAC